MLLAQPVLLRMKSSRSGRDTELTVSEENVELVRRALEALDKRDLPTWLAVHDEDFEVLPIRDFPETDVRGAEAAWNFYLETFDLFERFPVADVEVTDAGADKVLVGYKYDLRGRGSGAGVEFKYWVVATVRQGKILRARWFGNRDEALEAGGLSE
jgi:ketosteroid isomerase-like protein